MSDNTINSNQQNNISETKPKKPIYKKWWFWVIIGVVVIGILGCAGVGSEEESEKTTQKQGSKIAETKEDAAKVEKTKKEKTQYTVGETASYGGIKYTFKKAVVSNGDDFSQPGKGNEFVVCVFKVKNNSKDKIDVNAFDFEAYCDDNAVDDSFIDGNLDLVEKYGSLSVTNLAPGKMKKGCLTYEVPKGWKKIEINTKISPGLFDDKDVKFVVKNK